jgi:hypothetical protein
VNERRTAAEPEPGPEERADYAGAVYGSLLAASVVVGASPREEPASPATLIALLLATGFVFWLAHVYARLVGDRRHAVRLSRAEIRSVGRREWPLVQAMFPPAVAAGLCRLLDLSDSAASWTALVVAMCGQVGWSAVAGARSNAPVSLTVLTAVVNLFLGLIIVALKVLLSH